MRAAPALRPPPQNLLSSPADTSCCLGDGGGPPEFLLQKSLTRTSLAELLGDGDEKAEEHKAQGESLVRGGSTGQACAAGGREPHSPRAPLLPRKALAAGLRWRQACPPLSESQAVRSFALLLPLTRSVCASGQRGASPTSSPVPFSRTLAGLRVGRGAPGPVTWSPPEVG